MPRLVYIVVRDVAAPMAGGWTTILRVFETASAATAFAQRLCERQDLKNAANLLEERAVVRHRIVSREVVGEVSGS